eukprot:PhF_6_TR19026/c3_g1_i2/m.27917
MKFVYILPALTAALALTASIVTWFSYYDVITPVIQNLVDDLARLHVDSIVSFLRFNLGEVENEVDQLYNLVQYSNGTDYTDVFRTHIMPIAVTASLRVTNRGINGYIVSTSFWSVDGWDCGLSAEVQLTEKMKGVPQFDYYYANVSQPELFFHSLVNVSNYDWSISPPIEFFDGVKYDTQFNILWNGPRIYQQKDVDGVIYPDSELYFDALRPFRNSPNETVYIQVWIEMDVWSELLREIKSRPYYEFYIVSDDNVLITSTNQRQPLKIVTGVDDTGAQLYSTVQVEHNLTLPELKAAVASIDNWRLNGTSKYYSTSFTVNGEAYMGTASRFRFSNLKWTVLVVVPSADIVGEIDQATISSRTTMIILAAVTGGVTLILSLILAVAASEAGSAVWNSFMRGRDISCAPKDSSAPFCIVFTDVEGSTQKWAVSPEAMSTAIDTHHSLIRALIKQHKLYEVKTVGDSFMCATSDPPTALEFAMAVQGSLQKQTWPSDIGDLRVRIGIHVGVGGIVLDDVSKGYDYYGTVVNTAARIEAVGHGCQTLVSKELLDMCPQSSQYKVSDLGSHNLRGLSEAVSIFQVVNTD